MSKKVIKKKTTLSEILGIIAGILGVIFFVIIFFITTMSVGLISYMSGSSLYESGLLFIIFLFSFIGFISSIVGIIATDFENKKKSGWTMIVCGIIISMYVFLLISGILFIIAGIIKLKEKE